MGGPHIGPPSSSSEKFPNIYFVSSSETLGSLSGTYPVDVDLFIPDDPGLIDGLTIPEEGKAGFWKGFSHFWNGRTLIGEIGGDVGVSVFSSLGMSGLFPALTGDTGVVR